MGDRANIVLAMRTADERAVIPVWLYSHWGGEDFLTTQLANALEEARNRWDDETYFNRIIIQHVFADLAGSETGGGIGLHPSDNEHYVVLVDRATQTVKVFPDEHLANPTATYTFEKYIARFGGK